MLFFRYFSFFHYGHVSFWSIYFLFSHPFLLGNTGVLLIWLGTTMSRVLNWVIWQIQLTWSPQFQVIHQTMSTPYSYTDSELFHNIILYHLLVNNESKGKGICYYCWEGRMIYYYIHIKFLVLLPHMHLAPHCLHEISLRNMRCRNIILISSTISRIPTTIINNIFLKL